MKAAVIRFLPEFEAAFNDERRASNKASMVLEEAHDWVFLTVEENKGLTAEETKELLRMLDAHKKLNEETFEPSDRQIAALKRLEQAMIPAESIRAARQATIRESTPAAFLQEAVKAFGATTNPSFPIWRKKLPAWMTRFDRTIVVELLPSFAFRVRDPKSGQVLAESEPGKPGVLSAAFQPVERISCDDQD